MVDRQNELYVWEDEDTPVGVFTRHWQTISFHYDQSFPGPPISLSLPIGAPASSRAAGDFLANLVPDTIVQRSNMRKVYGAASIQPFDLLDRIDTAGGLIFSKDESYPSVPAMTTPIEPISDKGIATLIHMAKHAHGPVVTQNVRYSLAGFGGKFTLSYVDGQWYPSSALLPSTHIFKPSSQTWLHSDDVENATMSLAEQAGLTVPPHGMIHVDGEKSYIIQRFDREPDQFGTVRRIHCEDLLQALGMSSKDKYAPTAEQIIRLLNNVDPIGNLTWQFIQQLVFNTFCGNTDAHAKNYSIYLDVHHPSIQLTPIYDAANTRIWPEITDSLAMPINGKHVAAQITISDWKQFALVNNLDPARMIDEVQGQAKLIQNSVSSVLPLLPQEYRKRFAHIIRVNITHLLPQRKHHFSR